MAALNIESLRQQCRGAVLLPGSAEYEVARQCWNRAVDLYPTVIVVALSAADMQAAVKFAGQYDLKVLVQSTGHGAAPQTGEYLLVVTTRMSRVAVDAAAQSAWIEAGAVWGDVLKHTQLHGLAPLLGSSGTVGVVGYTLGGGIGWLARKYGLAVDSVLSIDVVTADGKTLRVTAREHADLFWALGGGSGGLCLVAAIEVKLYPVTSVWGGSITYSIAHAALVFAWYREWTQSLPDAMTSSIAIVNVPDGSGRSAVVVKGCFCGPADAGKELTSQWTDWKRPTLDTFAEMPFADVASISQDPVDPVPAFAAGGDAMSHLSDAAIAILIRWATTDGTTNTGQSPFLETEVRHVDSGAIRAAHISNAYSLRGAAFMLDIVASAPTPQRLDDLRRYTAAFKQTLGPYTSGGLYLNFADAELASQAEKTVDSGTSRRLWEVKRQYDPQELFLSAHPA